MKQYMASRRERKSEKVRVGLGLRQCEARYESGNCGEFCVRWRGLCALGEAGEEHGRVKAGAKVDVANRTWPIQDEEKERK